MLGRNFSSFTWMTCCFFLASCCFFFCLVLPLAVIHGLGHGRLRGGRDQDQIETQFLARRMAAGVGMTSTLPSGNTARTSRARMASLTFSRILVCAEESFFLDTCSFS